MAITGDRRKSPPINQKIEERRNMKLPYVKVTIEAPTYEAKAAAEQYSKDRKYEVLSRSKPYPCKNSSNVKIYLHVIKKTQLGYRHEGGWKKAGKHGKQRKSPRINYEALMMPSS